MKDYREIANSVFEQRDRYEAAKAEKRRRTVRAAVPMCSLCLAVLVGIGAWQSGIFEEKPVPVEDGPSVSGAEGTADESPVECSAENPPVSADPADPADPVVTEGDSVNGIIIFVSSVEWNGVTYRDNDMANASAYTRDRYIGKAGELGGKFDDTDHCRVNSDDSIYTVKETADVLFAVKADGSIVVMSSPDWSLEKYEPERLEPDYVDPNDDGNGPVSHNGFCHIFCTVESDGTVTYLDPDFPRIFG